MLKVGDLVIYSTHGICRIDDITEKTFNGIEKSYYVLRPIENSQNLTINAPVEQIGKVTIQQLMNKEEAEKILESFKSDGYEWIERTQDRAKEYNNVIKSGNREQIALICNTLMKKKYVIEKEDRKFYENDTKLLTTIKDILFKELAIALDLSYDEVEKQIKIILKIN